MPRVFLLLCLSVMVLVNVTSAAQVPSADNAEHLSTVARRNAAFVDSITISETGPRNKCIDKGKGCQRNRHCCNNYCVRSFFGIVGTCKS